MDLVLDFEIVKWLTDSNAGPACHIACDNVDGFVVGVDVEVFGEDRPLF